ncbi:MAG: CNP1-like family protein [Rhodoferax sp.]
MKFKNLLWLGLTLLTVGSAAQVLSDPDWKESEAPPPPAFHADRLIPIDMPSYVSLRFGVDPATLVITPDGIVRYVMVTRNATGAISAMYEGIRCARGEVKTYARYSSSGQWSAVKDPLWQRLNDNLPSRHALALARQGVCEGRAMSASSVADIVRALRSPAPAPER